MKKYVIILIIIISAGFISNFYMNKIRPVKISQENFNQACIYELQEEYEEALNCYFKVIMEDAENYKKAQDKIEALDEILSSNKLAVLGYIILKNEGYVSDISDVLNIQINIDKQMMTCCINEIGYVVSPEDLGDDDFSLSRRSKVNDYYITEYKAKYIDNGFLTADLNWIRQDTSNTLFKTEELMTSPELIKEELVLKYLSEYELTGKLPSIYRN